MDKINTLILNNCKNFVNRIPKDNFKEYYKMGSDVYIRDDAKDFTTDWVPSMNKFKGEIGEITYIYYDEPLININLLWGGLNIRYTFHYKSTIPLDIIKNKSSIINMYKPKKFDVNESFFIYNNNKLHDIIRDYNIELKVNIFIGDEVYVTKDNIKSYYDADFRKKHNINNDSYLEEVLLDLYANNKKVKVVGKFKGNETENFPWWSEIPTYGVFYIPDVLLTKVSPTPSYKPKTFIFENADYVKINDKELDYRQKDAIPFITTYNDVTEIGEPGTRHTYIFADEVINNFREDYYVNSEDYEKKFGEKPSNPITIKEIESYYDGQVYFYDYFQEMYEEDFYWDLMDQKYIGRLWLNSKVISFWYYPEGLYELKKIIKDLEKLLNIKIWNNGWKIQIIIIKNKIDFYGNITDDIEDTTNLKYSRDEGVLDDEENIYQSKYHLIPLESYKKSLNPPKIEFEEHLKSPLLKKIKKPIKGIGSSKKLPSSLPGELPVETRHRIYNESIDSKKGIIYLDRIVNLPMNCFFLSCEYYDENLRNKLIDFLELLNVYNIHILFSFNEEIPSIDQNEKAYLITLDGSFGYVTDFSIITTNYSILKKQLEKEDSKFKPPMNKIMNLKELYNYIQLHIVNPVEQIYKPRIFIKENKYIKKLGDFD